MKLVLLMAFAGIIIACITAYFYKPTYSVTLNGEFIGYTKNKSSLQAKINDAITKGEGENVAFIQIDNMPTYKLCLLKKDVETNDEEIYNKIVGQGTTYYRYYALLEDGEEKYYLSTFEEAEQVVNQLKEKESTNSEKLTVLEKYDTSKAEFADVETCASSLYKKKVVVQVAQSSGIGPTSVNNGAKVELGISLIRPVTGTITSRFGIRSRDNHKGIDIGADKGTPIYAAAAGTVYVSQYGYNGGYGNYVILSHGNGIQTVYGHCSELCVSVGETVAQGQLIAKVGSTGNSTGNHLHFEVRVNGVAQDPQNYVY
ncbi:MAG: M23 family metallopeptidase [Clostridia bacterium]